MTITESEKIVGKLTHASKMPCQSWNISARSCHVGGKMRKVEGSICSRCYAFRGNYNWPHVVNAQTFRLNALEDSRWVQAMVSLITNTEASGYFRWMDAGDLQSLEHLKKIVAVCEGTPHIKHWLPTREYVGLDGQKSILHQFFDEGGVIPKNLTVRLSALMFNQAGPKSIAKKWGLVTSGASKDGFNCPAIAQGHKCLTCRACWESKKEIVYKTH